MPNLDIVDMYQKGYSIEHIINSYYRYKTKNDKPNTKHGNIIIITHKTITKDKCKEIVYREIYEFLR